MGNRARSDCIPPLPQWCGMVLLFCPAQVARHNRAMLWRIPLNLKPAWELSPMSRIAVVATLEAYDGEFENLLKLAREEARHSMNEEPGCLKFEVLRPKEKPGHLVFVGYYADQAALDHHLGTERLAAFREAMLPLVSSRELTFCDVEEV